VSEVWEPVKSQGRLVYWRRRLPGGAWIAVNRDGNRWQWALYRRPITPEAVGYRSSSRLARVAADRHLASLTPEPKTS
jgi:hypothetical protein